MYEKANSRPKELVPSDLPGKFVVCVTPMYRLFAPFELVFKYECYMNMFAFRIPKDSRCGYADDGFSVDCRYLDKWIRFCQSPVHGNENRYILVLKGTGLTCEASVFESAKEIIDTFFPYYNYSGDVGEKMAAAVDLGFSCRGWSM